MSEYAYWRQYGPDLTALGVIRGTIDPDNRYFCTPVGAIVFGWTGVDGIHFCKIRRFREMIFAVSPANAPGEYVHPIARDFRDFLRLLITLGDANLLEQAWMWDRSRFMTERKIVAAEEDPERDEVIRRLIKKFSLTPMEDPYGYIHSLQDRFDYVLGDQNRRLPKANGNYYLLLHVKCPIVIVECGFLSNRKEAALLNSGEYQDKLAYTIHMGIMEYLNKKQ